MEGIDIVSGMEKVDIRGDSSAELSEIISVEVVPKYIGFGELEEGLHRVKSFSFIKVNKERRVRVDFRDNRFIIIPKDHILFTEKNFKEEDLDYANIPRHLFLRFWLDHEKKLGLHFYNSVWDRTLHYDDSKLQDIGEIFNGTYAVLLISIVKINDEDQIRVDIQHTRHFMLPKNHHQVNKKNVEWWNKQRQMVTIFGPHVEFIDEEDYPIKAKKWLCKRHETDEKEDEN